MYYCSSCGIYLHLHCALLPRDTDGDFINTLHVAHPKHPLILLPSDNIYLKYRNCHGCSSSLLADDDDGPYVCFDCKTFFHKKCLELPSAITHPYHRKHQLFLEFNRNDDLDCNLCESKHSGFFYGCSPCNVNIYCGCAWPPPIIEDKTHHEHQFTLIFRQTSFTCDACGTHGKSISYTCSACNIIVHKNCISLPRIIGINLHHHPLYHNFFIGPQQPDSKAWDCRICYKKVTIEHGSYYCSTPDCNNFIVHVSCAIHNRSWNGFTELRNQHEVDEYSGKFAPLNDKSKDCITCVVKEIKVGDDEDDVIAAEIIHISHEHKLTLSNEIKENKQCNGCVLPILSWFYYCSECDFLLHKACAELPSKRLPWFSRYPHTLRTNCVFKCLRCGFYCSGFSYKMDDGDDYLDPLCLPCATRPHSFTYQAHEPHDLFVDYSYKGHCSACGYDLGGAYRCKDCDFALDRICITYPDTVWHKCDKHPLKLAYQDLNGYPLHHYCDICEEERDPKQWFYHCQVCDTAVPSDCALGKHPFIKHGSGYEYENHHHPLTFVRNIYYYPKCVKCGEPCEDLSLECVEGGCNYVVHWKCISF
ncbi:hypothetical protein PTKIN_Ptkin15bG0167800 [Pterospermum kingtungense]